MNKKTMPQAIKSCQHFLYLVQRRQWQATEIESLCGQCWKSKPVHTATVSDRLGIQQLKPRDCNVVSAYWSSAIRMYAINAIKTSSVQLNWTAKPVCNRHSVIITFLQTLTKSWTQALTWMSALANAIKNTVVKKHLQRKLWSATYTENQWFLATGVCTPGCGKRSKDVQKWVLNTRHLLWSQSIYWQKEVFTFKLLY